MSILILCEKISQIGLAFTDNKLFLIAINILLKMWKEKTLKTGQTNLVMQLGSSEAPLTTMFCLLIVCNNSISLQS